MPWLLNMCSSRTFKRGFICKLIEGELSKNIATWVHTFFLQDYTYFQQNGSIFLSAAAAAKLLQSCPTLCDPIDGSPPGSPIPGILQARTLEWVATGRLNMIRRLLEWTMLWFSGPYEKSTISGSKSKEGKEYSRERSIRWQDINGRLLWWTPAMMVLIKVI